jgi:hypothetical protein
MLELALIKPHWRYPYSDVVVEFEWSNDPASYAGSRVATGRVSLARKVRGDDSRLKEKPWSFWFAIGCGAKDPNL